MAERNISERLQPALLDRLTDDAPDQKVEGRDRRVIDITRLRDIVRRDLSWLLNTNNLETQIDEERYPHAARSVVNFGVREVAGDYATTDRAERIRASMQAAIERFEPRIRDGSLQILLRSEENPTRTLLAFDIVADMWAEPLPLELYLRSEMDFTTGELHLEWAG